MRFFARAMNSADATPFPETSPMKKQNFPSSVSKKSYRSPPTSRAGSIIAEISIGRCAVGCGNTVGTMLNCSWRADSSSSSMRVKCARTSSRSRFFSRLAPTRALSRTGLKGFDKIIDRTELDASHDAVDFVKRRDHDHRNVVQPPLGFQPCEHLDSRRPSAS